MSILQIAALASAGFVGIGLIGVVWRLLRGPSTADRAIALDMLGLVGIAAASLIAVIAGHKGFIDVAFGIAILAFLTAVALAGLLERISTGDNAREGQQ
jgi:multicomponent Na+:H+ antiporter subunit F